MPTYQAILVDVFTDTPYTGNPLAVFPRASGLSDAQMQTLAREINYSETTFVFPPSASGADVQVRIFTPFEELPFAGHPTVGTATVLAWLTGAEAPAAYTLQLKVGLRTVRLLTAGRRVVGAEIDQGRPRWLPCQATRSAAAQALGLPEEAILPDLAVVSTGLPFLLVPVASLAQLAAMQVDESAHQRLLQENGAHHLYAYALTADGARARMPFHGREDPATGSAAGPLAAHLVRQGKVHSNQVIIQQGIEMGRPSRLAARVERTAEGEVAAVHVAGHVVPVGRSEFELA